MRAYGIHRPISIGCYPKGYQMEITNYDAYTYVEEIGRRAFGHIDFDEDVPQEVLGKYDLVTPKRDDPMLDRIVGQLMRHVDDGERFEKVLRVAAKRGYGEDRLLSELERRLY